MVSTYPLRTLGEMSENHDAQRIPVKAADRKPGPYPYYGAQGIVDYVDGYIFDGLFVLVAEDGENLRTRNQEIAFMADGKFWVNNHAHILRARSAATTRFLQYAINSTDISGYITGSTIPKLSQRSLHSIPIPCPGLTEQEEIADLLGSLDDKIELNRRMNETLEAMARAIFKDWFIDFGPTRAKAEGCAPYLAPEIWDLFPEKLDEDEKPVGWESFTLADLAHHHRATVSPSADPEHTFEHYSIPGYDTGNAPTLDLGGSIRSNKTVVPEGAVLLSKLNPEIERVWLPGPKGELSQVASTEFLAFTPLACATRTVLFCMFKSEAFRAEMAAMVTGTSKSHQRVSPKVLITREVLTTDPQLLTAFDEIVRPFLDRLLANRREARTLAQTRDLLLPKLMSGEIRLAEAEKAVA